MLPDLNHLLDTDTIAIKKEVRKFCDKHIVPISQDIDQQNKTPYELWPLLGELGLLGLTAPSAYGGSALGYLQHVVVMQEISRASASIGLSYAAHSNLCVNVLSLNATSQQLQKYLPPLCNGKHIGALAMSESEAGSDVVSMSLKATKSDDGFILNGAKMWITNAPAADTLIVYAKTTPDAGSKGISAFIVEKNFDGFKVSPKLDKLGMRGSETAEITFDNCFVPKENLLGELDRGVKVLMSGLDYERLVLSAGPLGIMQRCIEEVAPYLVQRKQFNQPIGSFQLMQAKLADMFTEYASSLSYMYAMALKADNKELLREEAASVILTCAEKATQMALQTIQCFGGIGYCNELIAGQLLRDAKLYEIGAGTSEIRRMLIGRELLKKHGLVT